MQDRISKITIDSPTSIPEILQEKQSQERLKEQGVQEPSAIEQARERAKKQAEASRKETILANSKESFKNNGTEKARKEAAERQSPTGKELLGVPEYAREFNDHDYLKAYLNSATIPETHQDAAKVPLRPYCRNFRSSLQR